MPGLDAPAGELTTRPAELDRVITQPRVTLTGVAHRSCQGGPGRGRRLIELDPEAALDDQQVRNAAGPVTGPDGADRDRVREDVAVEQRVRVRVALALELGDLGV